MDELLKELNSAYRMISSIPVTGDAIDLIAGARLKLRHVQSALKKMDEEQKTEEQTDV